MSDVLDQLGIVFGPSALEPMPIVRRFLAGDHVEDERRRALACCWKVVDDHGIRNVVDQDVLMARLAISLLSPDERGLWPAGEQLSWFLEVLGLIGADVGLALDAMETHFNFN
ncbi:MAG: hypothetical protein WA418_40635 [Bradyrhizobium sp.]